MSTSTPTSGLQGQRSLVLFRLGGHLCALPTESVAEALLLPRLSHPVGLPPFVEGFLNVGGDGIPVIRLDILFQLPEVKVGLYTPLILLKGAKTRFALLVEKVDRVRYFPAEAFLPVSGNSVLSRSMLAEVASDGENILLLEPDQLLLEGDLQAVELFTQAANQHARQPKDNAA